MNGHLWKGLGVLACVASLAACGNNGSTGTGGGGTGGSGGSGGAGGSGGSGAGGTGGYISQDAACDKLVSVVCDKLNMCTPFLMQVTYGDKATCMARTKLGCLATFKLDGITVTANDVGGCADAYGGVFCTDLFDNEPPAACQFKGSKDDGAACSSKVQCKNADCQVSAAGGPCGTCQTPAAEGASCAGADCASGLVCDSNMKCVKRPGKGEACGMGVSCSGGLACVGGKCDTPLGEGAACSAGADSGCDLLKGLWCDVGTNKCTAIKISKVGEVCGFDMATKALYACAAGSSCDSSTNKCVANLADGAACTVGGTAQCQTPAECRDMKCTTDPPVCK
jgi:hypothetical protein